MRGRRRGGGGEAELREGGAGREPRYPAAVRLAQALLLSSLAGCLPSASPSEPAPPARTGNAWADCYRRFEPGGDPAADVAHLGDACAAPAGLSPLGAPHVGAEQGEGDPPERLVLNVRRGCYRAFAVGGPGVDDLDVAIYDPEGRIAAAMSRAIAGPSSRRAGPSAWRGRVHGGRRRRAGARGVRAAGLGGGGAGGGGVVSSPRWSCPRRAAWARRSRCAGRGRRRPRRCAARAGPR